MSYVTFSSYVMQELLLTDVKLYDKLCMPTSFWVPPCWCKYLQISLYLHISAKSHLEISAKDSKLELQHQAELTIFLVGSWKFRLSELN